MPSPENKDVFFATSFSGHVDYNTGFVKDPFAARIETLLIALRDVGRMSVYCAVEAEGWRISQQAPGVSMATNYDNIKARSVFLALVDSVGSDGRGLEIQYAYDQGKQVFLATGPGEEPSWVMKEIIALGMAEHLPYQEPEELALTLAAKIKN